MDEEIGILRPITVHILTNREKGMTAAVAVYDKTLVPTGEDAVFLLVRTSLLTEEVKPKFFELIEQLAIVIGKDFAEVNDIEIAGTGFIRAEEFSGNKH